MSATTQILATVIGILLAIAVCYMWSKAEQDKDKGMKGVILAIIILVVIIGAFAA